MRVSTAFAPVLAIQARIFHTVGWRFLKISISSAPRLNTAYTVTSALAIIAPTRFTVLIVPLTKRRMTSSTRSAPATHCSQVTSGLRYSRSRPRITRAILRSLSVVQSLTTVFRYALTAARDSPVLST
jgi:hypothetical protein